MNEPGTLIWNELITDNADAAAAFYGAVVGLTSEAMDMGGNPYTVLKVGDDMVGGTHAAADGGRSEPLARLLRRRKHRRRLDKARELGASVVAGPFDTPIGPMAALSDPQGAHVQPVRPHRGRVVGAGMGPADRAHGEERETRDE